ncbi:hypothetical protein DY000_02017303 [Brassica cretica]|uniref:Uncharacterized protein n=1 Tax=Brassica cretica TaxID=69181 RepID=A0ABQ7CZS4_BRACR|nr:hypothetical protein DY000_02017303 [Brassica cretica]
MRNTSSFFENMIGDEKKLGFSILTLIHSSSGSAKTELRSQELDSHNAVFVVVFRGR